MGREQKQGGGEFARAGGNERGEALAKGTVADLIVILNADDLRGQWESGGGGSARTALPEAKWLALKYVGLGEHARKKCGGIEVLIIAGALAGEQSMNGVVEVVAPDGIDTVASLRCGKNVARMVLVGFGDDDDGAVLGGGEVMNAGGDLGDDVRGGIVLDGLNGVEAESVEMIIAQPVESVFPDEVADVRASGVVVIDGVAPESFVARGEVGTELREVIALVAEMVVNNIEDDGESVKVGGIDEAAERGGASVVGLHTVEADTIVSPIARAGNGVERHEFDGGDAEIAKVRQAMDGGIESTGASESANMEFVEYVVG